MEVCVCASQSVLDNLWQLRVSVMLVRCVVCWSLVLPLLQVCNTHSTDLISVHLSKVPPRLRAADGTSVLEGRLPWMTWCEGMLYTKQCHGSDFIHGDVMELNVGIYRAMESISVRNSTQHRVLLEENKLPWRGVAWRGLMCRLFSYSSSSWSVLFLLYDIFANDHDVSVHTDV